MLYTTVPGHYNIEDYGAIPDYRGSRTGSTTSGTPTLLVNDATGLTVGQKIAIAGVSDTKTILSISGATVTLSSNADVTVSAASVYTDNHDAFVAALAAMKNDNNEVRKLLISGWYYIGQTLEISQTLVIEGIGDARGTFQSAGVLSRTQPGTWLIFPKNITGLRLKSASTGDPGGQAQSAERTAIRNVTISCLDSSTISGHGIYASIIATYERVTVEGFGENGFYLYAFAGDFSGNADCSYLANCNALGNKLHGYHIEGSEANAITVFASTAFRNGYVGFYDASGAGGSGYFGCHSEGNGTLASAGQKYNYKTVGAGNTSTYFHCYNEDYDNCHFEGFVSIYGGSLPDGLKSTSRAHVVQNGRATSTPYSYLNRRGAAAGGSNVRAILGESPPFSSMGVLAFEQLGTGTDENYKDSLNWVFGGENDPWWITLVQRSALLPSDALADAQSQNASALVHERNLSRRADEYRPSCGCADATACFKHKCSDNTPRSHAAYLRKRRYGLGRESNSGRTPSAPLYVRRHPARRCPGIDANRIHDRRLDEHHGEQCERSLTQSADHDRWCDGYEEDCRAKRHDAHARYAGQRDGLVGRDIIRRSHIRDDLRRDGPFGYDGNRRNSDNRSAVCDRNRGRKNGQSSRDAIRRRNAFGHERRSLQCDNQRKRQTDQRC